MSHAAQREFFAALKTVLPSYFDEVRVLDCGSLDVNGSLKPLFTNSEYVGIDARPGRNVDIVTKVHEFHDLEPFDVVVSAEMLEHDEHWKASLRRMWDCLRPDGLLAISAAGPNRAEHGTRDFPDLGETPSDGIWGSSPDYYRNMRGIDFHEVFDVDLDFVVCSVSRTGDGSDVRFWGIKR